MGPTHITSGLEKASWSLDPGVTWSTHWTSWTARSWMAAGSNCSRRTRIDPGPGPETVPGHVTGHAITRGQDLTPEADPGLATGTDRGVVPSRTRLEQIFV